MRAPLAIASILLIGAPRLAQAEVSDKVATIPQLWVIAVVVGALMFLLSRAWLRVGVLLLPVTVLLAGSAFEPVLDKYVGPAVLIEQGRIYYLTVYASTALLVALHIAGLWLGLRRKHAVA